MICKALVSTLNIFKLTEEFDKENHKYPMFKWARMYMHQVTDLLQFLRSTRDRLWFLHLPSLKHVYVCVFAYNRLDYGLNIPEYIARVNQLQQTHREVWHDFENGGFTAITNLVALTAIGVDQVQELMNKIHKVDGGLSGITTDPNSLLRDCLSAPE